MTNLALESWIWYSIVVAITTARFTSRTLLLGSVRKLQVDDWLMLIALGTYTGFTVTLHIILRAGTNLFPPGFDYSSLIPEDIQEREYGSKIVLVVEECQLNTIWLVKACFLIMYNRVTHAHKNENRLIRALAVYVAFGYVFMQIFFLAVWCRPFKYYWAVPTPNRQCSTETNHLITNAVFNLSSDLMLLTISLQMIIRSSLPMRRKTLLCSIFGLGIFVILCAFLNKFYSFVNPYSLNWQNWYVRESSTALIVANLPFTWTLLRRIFNLNTFGGLHGTASLGTFLAQPLVRRNTASNNPTANSTQGASANTPGNNSAITSSAGRIPHSRTDSDHSSIRHYIVAFGTPKGEQPKSNDAPSRDRCDSSKLIDIGVEVTMLSPVIIRPSGIEAV